MHWITISVTPTMHIHCVLAGWWLIPTHFKILKLTINSEMIRILHSDILKGLPAFLVWMHDCMFTRCEQNWKHSRFGLDKFQQPLCTEHIYSRSTPYQYLYGPYPDRTHPCKKQFTLVMFPHFPMLTHRKSFPSYFRALVNSTVLAGMFIPIAKVSVANNAWVKAAIYLKK